MWGYTELIMPKFDDRFFGDDRAAELRSQEEERLITQLALQYGHPYVNLRGIAINPKALTSIPESEARAANLVAFEVTHKKLSVALRNPNNPATKALLDKLDEQWTLKQFMCSTASLEHAWKRYADQKDTTAVKKGVLDIDPDEIARLKKTLTTREKVSEALTRIRSVNNAHRVSSTIEVMFASAFGLGASDIHIEPEENGIRLRYRLDGVLHDIIDLERTLYERLISRVKLLAGLLLNVHDEAQDGRFTFDMQDKEIEVRTSVIPGASGESVVMRLLDPTVASFNMEQLGLNTVLYRVMGEELQRPNGMIITTGPTGSGKTTALYAFLRKAHTPEVKIITIEDPVEYKVDNIVQTQVGDDYTFASGLRSILRQDPDIIMLGEIRDREVAETAVHAAQTGHLVFSTLHTNNAVGAFPRLIDLGVDPRIMGSAINTILGQRLVRSLCKHCKKARDATIQERELITDVLATHPKPPPLPPTITLYEPDGCDQCKDTGFHGRQGVFEAIRMTEAVEEVIVRDPREHVILEAAVDQGIPTMAEDGMEKVIAGVTSLEELQRVVDLTRGRRPTDIKNAADDTTFNDHTV